MRKPFSHSMYKPMILTIAAKDLKSLFSSPLAWVILAVLNLVIAYIFLRQIDAYLAVQPQLGALVNPPGITEIIVAPLFATTSMILLMVVPILSMRLLAEERRQHTLSFLVSAPVSMTEIILGKFVGLMLFLALVIALIVAMAFSLYTGGRLDLGLLGANIAGLLLLTGSFAALGLYISSLTSHPAIAAIGGLGALVGLWVLNAAVSDPNNMLQYLSLLNHFESFNRGLIDTRDIAYFLLFIGLFLVLAIRRLDRDRLRA